MKKDKNASIYSKRLWRNGAPKAKEFCRDQEEKICMK